MPTIQKLIQQYKIKPVISTKAEMSDNRRLITGVGRASFARVWEPGVMNEGDVPKYSIQMLMPLKDKEAIKELVRVAANAAADEWGTDIKKWPRFKYNILNLPIEKIPDSIDPDDEDAIAEYFELNPHLKDVMIFSARNKDQPGIVDKSAKPIMDQDDFYSGCHCRISLFAGTYNQPASKGISFYLNNIMKTAEGESFGGGTRTAELDFMDYATESSDSDDSDYEPDEDGSGF